MKSRILLVILFFALFFPPSIQLTYPVDALLDVVRVPQDFPTIQQAIDASLPGGTVLVASGTYNENITVWKTLTINGESAGSTIIEQADAIAVCHVTADNVDISGFTLRGGSIGLWIDSCGYDSVTSTIATDNDDGMWVTSSYGSVVSNNMLTDNLFMGLYLEDSNSTSIGSNSVAGNTYGIYEQNSEFNTIHGNNISLNYADGIDAINSNHSAVFHNLISNNSLGIYLEGSNGNSIYENNLISNLDQVWVEGTTLNSWDDGSHGNYWSNYVGTDTNDDGIGDTPYIIDQNNQDHFPLMTSWTNIAIASLALPKNVTAKGSVLQINATVQNHGFETATFNVTAYANTTQIQTVLVPLAGRESITVTLAWNTSEFARAYNLTVNASRALGETDLSDNTKVYGVVKVSCIGDINGDYVTDAKDFQLVKKAIPSIPGSPKWNPNANVNNDFVIDGKDYQIVKTHIPTILP